MASLHNDRANVDIMRQKDDQPFAELLNRFRTASQLKKISSAFSLEQ